MWHIAIEKASCEMLELLMDAQLQRKYSNRLPFVSLLSPWAGWLTCLVVLYLLCLEKSSLVVCFPIGLHTTFKHDATSSLSREYRSSDVSDDVT